MSLRLSSLFCAAVLTSYTVMSQTASARGQSSNSTQVNCSYADTTAQLWAYQSLREDDAGVLFVPIMILRVYQNDVSSFLKPLLASNLNPLPPLETITDKRSITLDFGMSQSIDGVIKYYDLGSNSYYEIIMDRENFDIIFQQNEHPNPHRITANPYSGIGLTPNGWVCESRDWLYSHE